MKSGIRSAHRRLIRFGAVALVSAAAQAALAQPAPGEPPARPAVAPPPPGAADPQRIAPATTPLQGTVQGYNYAPRGEIEGLMLKSGARIVQVNLPHELAAVVSQAGGVGSEVRIEAIPAMGMPDHPVYEFYAMDAGQGRRIKLPSPQDERFVHLEGSIKQLNYGRRGEVNGAVLDSGDFVHVGPAAAATMNLAIGQKITVDGIGRPMLAGPHQSIDPTAINGQLLPKPPKPRPEASDGGPGPRDRKGPKGHHGPRDPDGPRPPAPPAPDGGGAAPPAPPAPR